MAACVWGVHWGCKRALVAEQVELLLMSAVAGVKESCACA